MALTALGLFVRLIGLGNQSLWHDEVITYRSAAAPIGDIVLNPFDPNIPPLYYLLVHGLLGYGTSETVLRFPSLLAGVASIPLLYMVTRARTDSATAVTAAALLALAPLHIWYSQEARPYALLMMLGLAAVALMQRLQVHPHDRLASLAFILAASAAFYMHTVALPFLALLALCTLLAADRNGGRSQWMLRWACVALLAVPAAFRFTEVAPPAMSANTGYRFDLTHIAYALWTFITGFSLGPTTLELREEGLAAVRAHWLVVASVFTLAVALCGYGLWLLWRRQRGWFGIVAGWLAVPLAFAAAGSILTPHAFNVRYVILSLPAFLLATAVGIRGVPDAKLRLGAFVGLLAASIAALGNYYFDPRFHRENTRAAVRFINSVAEPGQLVIASAPYMTIDLEHYGLRRDLTLIGYPPPATSGQEPGLDSLGRGRSSVTLFLSRTFHGDSEGRLLRHFDSTLRRTSEFRAAGVHVAHYRAAHGGQPAAER